MPRLPPFYSGFFYSPLTEDVEELLARLQQTDSIRYEDFSAVWRDMSFSDVFLGIRREGERKRFCRITLATAVKYFLPPYSYQIRVGGLYLMFAFYHTQTMDPPVQIRLALRDWAEVQNFLKDSVDSGHQDVVYIYRQLVANKAIHYTAMPHFLTFHKQRKPKREPVRSQFLGRPTAVQELVAADIMEELSNIHSRYEMIKGAATEVSSQVNMTHSDFAACVGRCMSEYITWQERAYSQSSKDVPSSDDEEKPTEAESSGSSRAKLLSSIKQRSFENCPEASKSRRHRQATAVESSSSGVEQVKEDALQSKRPPSLRARTWKSLGRTPDERKIQTWLLSAPEQRDRLPMKRVYKVVPSKP